MSDLLCAACGAKLDGAEVCPKCGKVVGLEEYGYTVARASSGGFVLNNLEGASLYAFKSYGSVTVKELGKRTQAPTSVIEGALARLVAAPQVEGEEEEDETPVKLAPFVELPDGRLAEQAFDGNDVYYLVYDPKGDRTERLREIAFEEVVLRPIDNDEVRDRTVLLPSEASEYGSEEKLAEEIQAYLNRWHEPPNPLSRTLDVFYDFLSYIKDLVPQLPYRRYLAPWGRGKSAWLEAIGWISYRGIVLAGSDTDKSVVRKMNNWRGTALIDEADFGDSSFYSFLVKILNIGYDRKTGFYHRSDDNDPNKVLSYCVYGPKILATRAKYKDLALESRCLTTVGRENVNPVPLFRMEKFQAEALELRNKLILWRFRNYYRIKAAAAELEDPRIAERVYDGADNMSSRVKQVILPLWLIGGDAFRDTLTRMAKTFDARLKIEDPDYLLELQACDAVRELLKEEGADLGRVNIVNIRNILVEGGEVHDTYYEVTLSTISRAILDRQGRDDGEIGRREVTAMSKHLKRVFEANLGFNIRIGKGRARVVLIPLGWVDVKEKQKDMLDFIEAGLIIDVQNVHDVHPEGDSDDDYNTSDPSETTDLTATGDPREGILVENTPLIEEVPPPSSQQSAPGDEPPKEKGKREESLVSALLKDIRGNEEVGELWPRNWLEIHGIPRTEAEEIIIGLHDAGKITRTKGGWKI